MIAWEPIETAPRGQTLVGLRKHPVGLQPAFVGEVYDLSPNCLIDRWSGRWCECTHYLLLPPAPDTPSPCLTEAASISPNPMSGRGG